MRIAYVVPMTWACGGILAPFSQANELVARGHEVTVYVPDDGAVDWFPLLASPQALPRDLEDIPLYDHVVYVGDSFRRAGRLPARRRFLLLQGKDHVWATDSQRSFLLNAYADPKFHILAVSRWLAEFAREECDAQRVTIVGNGVDTGRFFPDTAAREGFRLLIEGNFPDRNKNVIDALEVASRVRQHEKVEVWALARRFASPGPLVDKIFENPPQESIPGIYQQCDLLVKTSIMEGFGLPHLEAMACGCVPATYACGGVSDLCRHDENSLVTGTGNVPMLVWHIVRFLADPALRLRLRENAIATARGWTWKAVGDALESVLRRELEDPS